MKFDTEPRSQNYLQVLLAKAFPDVHPLVRMTALLLLVYWPWMTGIIGLASYSFDLADVPSPVKILSWGILGLIFTNLLEFWQKRQRNV